MRLFKAKLTHRSDENLVTKSGRADILSEHARIHICIYTYIHTYIHTIQYMHTYIYPCKHTKDVYTYIFTCTYIHTCMHRPIYTHAYIIHAQRGGFGAVSVIGYAGLYNFATQRPLISASLSCVIKLAPPRAHSIASSGAQTAACN